MKISSTQSQSLLDLVQRDQKLKQLKTLLQSLTSGDSLSDLRAQYSSISSELLLVQNQFEAIAVELRRSEDDLKTVEDRIRRDKERINQTSSAKDIQGIESELATLAKRKSDLEDVELGHLEALEDSKKQLTEVQLRHDAITDAIAAAERDLEAKLISVRAEQEVIAADRAISFSSLGDELSSLYERKATRGIAAGRLLSGRCDACQMQIGAVDLDHLLSAAPDEVVFCPECQAILIRI